MQDVVRPVPGPDEVVVRVRAALTCGTDVKSLLRGHPKLQLPSPLGHEFAGELAAVGSNVKGFREGDAVMGVPSAPCDECYVCRRGQENLCGNLWNDYAWGAFAQYLKLPARVVTTNLYPKPAELPFADAALLEPLSCVVHGMQQIRVRPDDTVVLIGAGAISLLHVQFLRALGVAQIVVIGRGERRAAFARAAGASVVLTEPPLLAREAVLDLTDGRGADVVIECTGQVEVWEAAPALARRGGTVVMFGGCPAGTVVRLDTHRFHYDELHILSPFHFTPRAVRMAYERLTGGQLKTAALISGEFPLADLSEALARHQRGEGIKFAILP
ncbi:MAG TPA: alcohol dehydrogenase catalytic domain-containing protein [Candidatus Binatia bacterium]|nr:alcohol dehydrogenase catalytic domain-containing protein [Candidatus Binatia bacterium]